MKTSLVIAALLFFSMDSQAQRFVEKSWFTVSDASPLADPYTAAPDGHEWDAVQTTGTLAISGNALVFTNGTADNQLGIRRTTGLSRELGLVMLGEILVTDAVDDAAGNAYLGVVFGYTQTTNIAYHNFDEGSSWGFTATDFGMFFRAAGSINHNRYAAPMPLHEGHVYRFAHVLGGYGAQGNAANPFYTGQTASSFTAGGALFLKDVTLGTSWKRQFHSFSAFASTLYPMFTATSGDGSINTYVIVDSLPSLMIPTHFCSMIGTNATDITALTPEEGSAYVSAESFGDWQVSSNYVVPNGTAADNRYHHSVADVGIADVYGEMTINLSSSENGGFTLRHKASDDSFIYVGVSNASNILFISTYPGGTSGSYTTLTSAAFSPTNDADFKLVVHADADTVTAWALDVSTGSTTPTRVQAVTSFNDTETLHGVHENGAGPTSPLIKLVAFYKVHDSSYNAFDGYINEAVNPTRLRRAIIVQ